MNEVKLALRLFILVFTVIFLLGELSCNAQKIVVKGKIFDNLKKPLPNACISINESNKKTFSDSVGNYIIRCRYGDNLYVNYKNQLVENVKVLHDTLTIILHEAREMCWDGIAYDNYITIIPSAVYRSELDYSVDFRYSFAHTNKIKEVFDFGLRYLNCKESLERQLFYCYVNLRSPYSKAFVIRKLNPYINVGYFGFNEKGKQNYYNFGYDFGLSFPKKYFRLVTFQLSIGYSHYLMTSTNDFLTLGLSIGLTSTRGIGGSDYY